MMEKTIKAQLILENGTKFTGTAFGYVKESVGEVIFNTSMTGYQELLTDPSCAGQLVVSTYPLVGNYGINLDDNESDTPRLRGLIVREKSDFPSNWRCEMDLDGYLKQNKIVGLEGIDTRALTRILRDNGTMKGIITTRVDDLTPSQIEQKFGSFNNKNAIKECTCKEKYEVAGSGTHVAFLDIGTKRGMIREFTKRDCKITVFPAFTLAEEILAIKPDGFFVSSGPGNPNDVPEIVENVKKIIESGMPTTGICTGTQIIGLALGAKSEKMKFGHHGENHPVRDEKTKKVYISAQGHDYVLCDLPNEVIPSFTNINDDTVEGIQHTKLPVYGVQFHPEASPGPLETNFIFDRFLEIMERRAK